MSINHRAEAEKYLVTAARHLTEVPADMRIAEVAAAIGQGYATLANNTVNDDLRDANARLRTQLHGMRHHVSSHIAHALTSTDPVRWKAARDLAQGLDSADVNIDNDIDEHLADDGHDPKAAWNASNVPERADDPWAPDPGVQKIQNFYRITTEHVVQALLDPNEIRGGEWARRLTWALEQEGIDLTDGIKARINDLTLGRDPSEPPF